MGGVRCAVVFSSSPNCVVILSGVRRHSAERSRRTPTPSAPRMPPKSFPHKIPDPGVPDAYPIHTGSRGPRRACSRGWSFIAGTGWLARGRSTPTLLVRTLLGTPTLHGRVSLGAKPWKRGFSPGVCPLRDAPEILSSPRTSGNLHNSHPLKDIHEEKLLHVN